jgi:hypothetical protein
MGLDMHGRGERCSDIGREWCELFYHFLICRQDYTGGISERRLSAEVK